MRPRKPLLGLFVRRRKETNETAAKLSISPALPCYRKKLERLGEKRSPFEKWVSRLAGCPAAVVVQSASRNWIRSLMHAGSEKMGTKVDSFRSRPARKIEKKCIHSILAPFLPFFPRGAIITRIFRAPQGVRFFAKEGPKVATFALLFGVTAKAGNCR